MMCPTEAAERSVRLILRTEPSISEKCKLADYLETHSPMRKMARGSRSGLMDLSMRDGGVMTKQTEKDD